MKKTTVGAEQNQEYYRGRTPFCPDTRTESIVGAEQNQEYCRGRTPFCPGTRTESTVGAEQNQEYCRGRIYSALTKEGGQIRFSGRAAPGTKNGSVPGRCRKSCFPVFDLAMSYMLYAALVLGHAPYAISYS